MSKLFSESHLNVLIRKFRLKREKHWIEFLAGRPKYRRAPRTAFARKDHSLIESQAASYQLAVASTQGLPQWLRRAAAAARFGCAAAPSVLAPSPIRDDYRRPTFTRLRSGLTGSGLLTL